MSGQPQISDTDLHAFMDGALGPEEAHAVAAAIEADSVLATRVAAFRADKARLKQIYAAGADRPVPEAWLALARNSKPSRLTDRRPLSWGIAAAIAAALVVALAGTLGWRLLQPQAPTEIVQAALDARIASSVGERAIAVAPDASPGQYDAVLRDTVAMSVKVPDLKQMGYHLAEIRLYPHAPRTGAAQLLYRDGHGRLFTLYVRRSDGTARFDQFERAGLRVCIWQDDQVGMVVAGNISTAAMQRLATLAYNGLTSST